MIILETARLLLRQLTPDDAPFILTLLNDPAFLEYIGDRGVHTLEDARQYIRQSPMAMYKREGFGLYLTALSENNTPIGICGLIKRDGLEDVDIGFAFLPQYRGQGYAYEAAAATMTYGYNSVGLKRIVAITHPDNTPSIKLLERLGMTFSGMIRLTPDDSEIKLFASAHSVRED